MVVFPWRQWQGHSAGALCRLASVATVQSALSTAVLWLSERGGLSQEFSKKTISFATMRERLIKTGARLVRHGRYAVFQMAAAALAQEVFDGIFGLINTLGGPPIATGVRMIGHSRTARRHPSGRIGASENRRNGAKTGRRGPLGSSSHWAATSRQRKAVGNA
jgi:hypothetical protein